MLAGVQLVNVAVVTRTAESAADPSNVVAVLAGPDVPVNVPLQSPSVPLVAAAPMAVNEMVSPLAVSDLPAAFKGKDNVDVTGTVGAVAVVPPPPPPPQAVNNAARHSPVMD